MTRDEATKLLDCSLSELAGLLGITTAAVAKWDKEQIPKLREYEIKDLAKNRDKSVISKNSLRNQNSLKNIQK